MSQQEAHAVFDQFDVEIPITVLSKTVFSPFFAVFVPLTLMGQGYKSSTAVFQWSCLYTVVVCFFGLMRHISRLYDNQSSWLLRPRRADWEEQIVLVTGGASGVGALLADTLAIRNVTVVVLDVNPVQSENTNIASYICDVSDYKQVMAVAARVKEEVGSPTMIVNNAGVVKGKLLVDLTEDDIKSCFGVNTMSHYWILKAFLPAMLEAGNGHIVTISSVLSLAACAQMTDYCASKAALNQLHASLRFELDNRYHTPAIRTSLFLPGHISTPLFARLRMPTNWFVRFVAPSVQPHVVVKHIIAALDDQESRVIRLPSYTNVARIMNVGTNLMPGWSRDLLQRISGADFAMRDYGPQGSHSLAQQSKTPLEPRSKTA